MSITAILAPTNTGKTHRAVERMLSHATGMIGLPLRLLAREVYDRISALRGESEVALVTGEEKRVPPSPRYWVCTVESMPVSVPVDFLAVDEIQLSAHHQRGHVFTDRLLNARGRQETWFLGADTMQPLLKQLVPEVEISRHPRLSQLRHAGAMSLRTLPPRSAIVAFSVSEVYEIAERLRERRGGVAVVLGALSPRTRNAQVAMYQSGEVQYMVATDAIGMGLNMDVDHIAFASLNKYDGREHRPLDVDELAQIAGRAGRYRNDGTFGTLSPLPPLGRNVVSAIETHRFRSIDRLVWRNSDLDMRTIDTLIASLSRRPERSSLRLVDYSEDFSALTELARSEEIRALTPSQEAVELLWEVCQIPDFRKLLEGSHIRFLGDIYRQLSGPKRRIDADWMSRHITRLDDVTGDIDTLMQRIAFIRTWTYISHRNRWIHDAEHWRERTRAIEDRLSDALHQGLVQRFVERRRQSATRPAADAGGSPFGKLRALLASEDSTRSSRWVEDLVSATFDRFRVDEAGRIYFDADLVGRMTRGVDLLRPDVTLLVDRAGVGVGAHARILRRLTAWTRDLVGDVLAPLRREAAARLSPVGRGLLYQLEQGLGTVYRRQAEPQLRDLSDEDLDVLDALEVEVGQVLVYVPSLLAPPVLSRRIALASATLPGGTVMSVPPPQGKSQDSTPADGQGQSQEATQEAAKTAHSLMPQPDIPSELYTAIGYPIFGSRAIRADIAERVHRGLADTARQGPFLPPKQLSELVECPDSDAPAIIEAFGYRPQPDGRFVGARRRRNKKRRR